MNNSLYPLARTSGLVVQEVPNEVLVFDMETNEAHCLNETAAMVWKYCDGNTSVPQIAQILGENKGSNVNDDLVWLAIDQLNEVPVIGPTHDPIDVVERGATDVALQNLGSVIAHLVPLELFDQRLQFLAKNPRR